MGGVGAPTRLSTASIPWVSDFASRAFSEEKAIPEAEDSGTALSEDPERGAKIELAGLWGLLRPGRSRSGWITPLAKMSRNFSLAVTTATFRPAFMAPARMVSQRTYLAEFIITSCWSAGSKKKLPPIP